MTRFRAAGMVLLLASAGLLRCGNEKVLPGEAPDAAGLPDAAYVPADAAVADAASEPPDAAVPADAAGPADAAEAPDAAEPPDAALEPPDAATPDGGRCPVEMADIQGTFCIDRWESWVVEVTDGGEAAWSPYYPVDGHTVKAVTGPGRQPQGYISGSQARDACTRAGKRLCDLTEWLAACRGPAVTTYPYGTTYQAQVCNEGRAVHPVVEYFGTSVGVWDSVHMNDPGINQQADTVANGGAYSGCTNGYGVYDLVGNLHEWISDTGGTFKGGFYVDAELNGHGCLYTTTAHAFSYHDYSTGFRCCR